VTWVAFFGGFFLGAVATLAALYWLLWEYQENSW